MKHQQPKELCLPEDRNLLKNLAITIGQETDETVTEVYDRFGFDSYTILSDAEEWLADELYKVHNIEIVYSWSS